MGASGFTFVLGRRTRENHVSRWRGFASAPSSLLLPCRGGTQSAMHCLFSRLFISTCLLFFFSFAKCKCAFTSHGPHAQGSRNCERCAAYLFSRWKSCIWPASGRGGGGGLKRKERRRKKRRRAGLERLPSCLHLYNMHMQILLLTCLLTGSGLLSPALMEKKWDKRWEQDEGRIKTCSLN